MALKTILILLGKSFTSDKVATLAIARWRSAGDNSCREKVNQNQRHLASMVSTVYSTDHIKHVFKLMTQLRI